MTLHYLDISIISIYLITVFLVGFLKKSDTNLLDYVLMGRRLSLMPFVMTLVSTWYGGILGVSEFSYSYGISNWVIFGLPYYCFGLVFALFVAKRAHRLRVSSLPEIMGQDYGKTPAILSAVWVLFLATPAPYILTLGFLLNYFIGIPLAISVVLGALFSLIYIFRGGFDAVVNTDILQFILMFVGFGVLVISLSTNYLSPLELWQQLPESHRSFTGGHDLGYILVWFFIGSWTLVDPGFQQRVYATRTGSVARSGILLAVVFWFIFDLLTTLTGLYAFSYLPPGTPPAHAFLVLGDQILPIGLKGLFYTGILATVMSTLDSNALVSGISLGKDILAKLAPLQRYSLTALTKFSMLVIMAFGILMAILIPSVVDLWYVFSTIAIPALLLPTMLSIFNRRLRPGAALLNLSLPPLAALGWFIFAKVDPWNYVWGLEPFYPGIALSIIVVSLSKLLYKESSHG